jgi:hypothetical protein
MQFMPRCKLLTHFKEIIFLELIELSIKPQD